MNALQLLVDGMNQAEQKKRSVSQLTLGGIIKALESLPSDTLIHGLGELDSYRGYYCDLAFEPISESRTVENILVECKNAMGQVFQGYKGGDFLMGATTPLWLAHYGLCGKKIMAIQPDGTIETER